MWLKIIRCRRCRQLPRKLTGRLGIDIILVMLKLNLKIPLAISLIGLTVATITLPFAAVADTQTTNTNVNLAVNPVISSWTSGPTVTLGAITPDNTGKQSIASDTVTANTNDTAGLTITMASSTAATTMVSGANSIAAIGGTPAAPAALTNGTWGWRIDSLATFGVGPTSIISNAAPNAGTFAAMPATGSPYTIKTTAATGSTTNTVWYSSRVNNAQPIGTYNATVTYTIITN